MKALLLLALVASLQICEGRALACAGGSCAQQCVTSCDCGATKPKCYHQFLAGKSECIADVQGHPEEPIFFVHIGKTGGTTFRSMAEAAFGEDRMCLIYFSGHGERASPLVKSLLIAHEHGLSREQRVKLFVAVARETCSYIGGHVAATHYLAHIGLRRIVTFIREPADHLISLYYHKQRDALLGRSDAEQATFDQFARETLRSWAASRNAPWQRLNVASIPPQAYGFVGVTELYNESIALFNEAYALDFRMVLRHNTNSVRAEAPPEQSVVGPQLRALLDADYAFYSLVMQVFHERQRMAEACKPYVHGAVDGVEGGVLRGSAWWAHSDDAVKVRVLVGGVDLGVAVAQNPHALAQWGAPRSGLVGFEFRLPPSWGGSAVARLEVAETGQLLGEIDAQGKGTLLWSHISQIAASQAQPQPSGSPEQGHAQPASGQQQ